MSGRGRGDGSRWFGRGVGNPSRFCIYCSAFLLVIVVGCASSDPYQGLEGDALWRVAMEAYEDGDWSEAAEVFQRFVNQNPADLRVPEARIMTARAHMEDGDEVLAAAEFERFLLQHSNHGLAPEASLGVCRAYARLRPHRQRDQTYTIRARDACAATVAEFQGLSVAEEAETIRQQMVNQLIARMYDEARFYQRIGAHNSAILYYEELIAQYPQSEWVHRALLGMYRAYRSLGWSEEAEEVAEELVARFPDSDSAMEVREEIGDSVGQGADSGT